MVKRETSTLECHLFRYICIFKHQLGSVEPGAVSAKAEDLKISKYSNLDSSYLFVPGGVASGGAFDPKTMSLPQCLLTSMELIKNSV